MIKCKNEKVAIVGSTDRILGETIAVLAGVRLTLEEKYPEELVKEQLEEVVRVAFDKEAIEKARI